MAAMGQEPQPEEIPGGNGGDGGDGGANPPPAAGDNPFASLTDSELLEILSNLPPEHVLTEVSRVNKRFNSLSKHKVIKGKLAMRWKIFNEAETLEILRLYGIKYDSMELNVYSDDVAQYLINNCSGVKHLSIRHERDLYQRELPDFPSSLRTLEFFNCKFHEQQLMALTAIGPTVPNLKTLIFSTCDVSPTGRINYGFGENDMSKYPQVETLVIDRNRFNLSSSRFPLIPSIKRLFISSALVSLNLLESMSELQNITELHLRGLDIGGTLFNNHVRTQDRDVGPRWQDIWMKGFKSLERLAIGETTWTIAPPIPGMVMNQQLVNVAQLRFTRPIAHLIDIDGMVTGQWTTEYLEDIPPSNNALTITRAEFISKCILKLLLTSGSRWWN